MNGRRGRTGSPAKVGKGEKGRKGSWLSISSNFKTNNCLSRLEIMARESEEADILDISGREGASRSVWWPDASTDTTTTFPSLETI